MPRRSPPLSAIRRGYPVQVSLYSNHVKSRSSAASLRGVEFGSQERLVCGDQDIAGSFQIGESREVTPVLRS